MYDINYNISCVDIKFVHYDEKRQESHKTALEGKKDRRCMT